MSALREFILSQFNLPANCFRHCSSQTELRFLEGYPETIGCYVCPSGYVSRIILFYRGKKADQAILKRLLDTFNDKLQVKDSDLRVATRHTWDLNVYSDEDPFLQEVYWTQNYRRSEENPARPALFLCLRCNALFVQPISSARNICEKCEAS